MKTSLLKKIQLFCFLAFLSAVINPLAQAQSPQGEILYDSPSFKVLRIWGTHAERGYAYGFIIGSQINTMMNNYIKPGFGNYYSTARSLILNETNFEFEEKHLVEAAAIIEGMNASGNNPNNLDITDLLVGNAMLDIQGLLGMKGGPGCSTLISWGDATNGTSLNGHAVATRHLDWSSNSVLLNNHLLVIHQPAEQDEQNWMMIGFAGMMGALSGINNQTAVFQHMMDDYSGAGQQGKAYKPIWFAMREAVEAWDYNQDGINDAADLESVMNNSSNGYANGYIISCVADEAADDDHTAMIAELAPTAPTHVYRTNGFADSIPGDNLYCANYQIARNDLLHFCSRYNSIRNHIGNGTMLGVEENWTLMRDWSHQSNNIQLMQFAPSQNHFRIAVKKTSPAYLSDFVDFDLNEILNETTGIETVQNFSTLKLYPNPASKTMILEHKLQSIKPVALKIINSSMTEMAFSYRIISKNQIEINTDQLISGIYVLSIMVDEKVLLAKFVKL